MTRNQAHILLAIVVAALTGWIAWTAAPRFAEPGRVNIIGPLSTTIEITDPETGTPVPVQLNIDADIREDGRFWTYKEIAIAKAGFSAAENIPADASRDEINTKIKDVFIAETPEHPGLASVVPPTFDAEDDLSAEQVSVTNNVNCKMMSANYGVSIASGVLLGALFFGILRALTGGSSIAPPTA